MLLFNEDEEVEFGMFEKVQVFKELLMSYDGFFIVLLEYNLSYFVLLKNVIDWVLCMGEGEKLL